MTDKTLKILLGIIAVNLTFQTVKDVGLFPTAHAQMEYVPAIGFGVETAMRQCWHRASIINGIVYLTC